MGFSHSLSRNPLNDVKPMRFGFQTDDLAQESGEEMNRKKNGRTVTSFIGVSNSSTGGHHGRFPKIWRPLAGKLKA